VPSTPERVLEHFARAFLSWTHRWLEEGFAPIRAAWLERAVGLGEEIRVRLPAETLTGTFAALDESGALLLDTEAGRRTIMTGDVFAPA
jgi:BirA family biotin operon repressor/biotin-[acetyl-CoA-carboxylase] ligase